MSKNSILGIPVEKIRPFCQLPFEILYYPLDTWKTRLQYKSIHGVHNVNGLKNTYNGFGVTLAVQLASTFFFYRLADLIISVYIFLTPLEGLKLIALLIIAYSPACFVSVLREFIKIPQQVDKNSLKWNGMKGASKHGNFFQGFCTTFVAMIIDIFHNVIDARIILIGVFGITNISYPVTIGFVIVLIILPPLDLAKTAILSYDPTLENVEKSERGLENVSCVTDENKNFPFKILLSVYNKRGIFGLYAGFIPILIRMILITIISRFLEYDV